MPQFKLTGPLLAAALLVGLLAVPPASAVRSEQDGVIADGVEAAPPPALRADWMRYRASAELRLLDWLADGTLLVAQPGPAGMQAARVAAPLAASEPVGGGVGGITDGAAHPFDGQRAVLRSVDGGVSRLLDLRGLNAAGLPLADAPADARAPLWAHDGRRLAYARGRDDGGSDVVVTGTDGGEVHAVVGDGGRWQVLDWSRDDRALLLRRELPQDDARLFVADVASAALSAIDAPAGGRPLRMRLAAARFTPAGDAVLYLRDDGEEGSVRLKLAPLDGAPPRALSPPQPHDVERFAVSADGRYLAYSWSEAGYSRVSVLDQRTHTPLALPAELPAGVITQLRFERGGARLALELSTATTPPEIDVIDLAAGTLVRWVQASAAGNTRLAAQRFRFRTWDHSGGRPRELAAFLYAPPGPGPHPVLVLLHDGPAGEFRPGYDPWLQFLAGELGIAVVAPNLRGSGGAGRAFAALADGALREDVIRDLGSLLVWIGAQPTLDAGRVAVMGSGLGGQQALAALAAYGDRLRGAVAIDPPADPPLLDYANALLRPALLAHLDGTTGSQLSGAEQLLWRLRANRREAAYLGLDARACALGCPAAENTARAGIARFLQGLLAPGADAAALSATRAP